jgi:hypothetical protein
MTARRVADALAATRIARHRVAAGRSLALEIRRQHAAIWEHRGAEHQAPRAGRGER